MTVQGIEELLAQDQKQQEAVITDRAPSSTPVENPPQGAAASPNNNASEREVGEQQHAVGILQAEQNRVSGGRVKLPKLYINLNLRQQIQYRID